MFVSDTSDISDAEIKCYQTYMRSWKDYVGWAEELKYNLKVNMLIFQKTSKMFMTILLKRSKATG